MGNADRRPDNCAHCVEVRDWRLQQDADVRAIEVPAQDEDARPMSFRQWLEHRAGERRAEREDADRWVA